MPTEEERARRQHAAAREQEVEKALASQSGTIPEILARLGITQEKGHGMALYNRYTGFYPIMGLQAAYNSTYDPVNKMVWDPLMVGPDGKALDPNSTPGPDGTFYRGGWRPMTAGEIEGMNKMQQYRDQYGEGNYNPWRIERLQNDITYGHVERDPVTGLYKDVRPNGNIIYYDERYQPVSPPAGAPTRTNPQLGHENDPDYAWSQGSRGGGPAGAGGAASGGGGYGYGGMDTSPGLESYFMGAAANEAELARQTKLDTLQKAFEYQRSAKEYASGQPLESYLQDFWGNVLGVEFDQPPESAYSLEDYFNQGLEGGGVPGNMYDFLRTQQTAQQNLPGIKQAITGTGIKQSVTGSPTTPTSQNIVDRLKAQQGAGASTSSAGDEVPPGLQGLGYVAPKGPDFLSPPPTRNGVSLPPPDPGELDEFGNPISSGGVYYPPGSNWGMAADGPANDNGWEPPISAYSLKTPGTIPPYGNTGVPPPKYRIPGAPPPTSINNPPGTPPPGQTPSGKIPAPLPPWQNDIPKTGPWQSGPSGPLGPTPSTGSTSSSTGTSSAWGGGYPGYMSFGGGTLPHIPLPQLPKGGGYHVKANALDPNDPTSWALLAKPANQIASDLDFALERYKAEMPIGGDRSRGVGELINSAYGNIAGLRQGLVREALGNIGNMMQQRKFGVPLGEYTGSGQSLLNASTSRYGADVGAAASRYGSDRSLEGSRYGADKGYDLGLQELSENRRQYNQSSKGGFWRTLGGLASGFLGGYGSGLGARMGKSSRRWKKNIAPLRGALNLLRKLRGVRFEWGANAPDNAIGPDLGFIAEEVAQVVPECTFLNAKGEPIAVDYAKFTALLVEAVKEQQVQIEELQKILFNSKAAA